MRAALFQVLILWFAIPAMSETFEVAPTPITEWKAVYGQIETRDRIPARARIGGTVQALEVTEGDIVTAGQRIATIEDDKLNFQIDALNARLGALQARLTTARADADRGVQLLERGVVTSQRVEQLQTAVDVINGEIRSLESEILVVEQQIEEGGVLAPDGGVVLSVPVSRGSVITPGEAVAEIGGGGAYLRLAIPERHSGDLAEGDQIEIGGGGEITTGRLVKLYPQIEGGRIQADVEVEGLSDRFVGRRIPVRLPVGEREAILVPEAAILRNGGLDFVTVETDGEEVDRAVVPGEMLERDGMMMREILTGLRSGDRVVFGDE